MDDKKDRRQLLVGAGLAAGGLALLGARPQDAAAAFVTSTELRACVADYAALLALTPSAFTVGDTAIVTGDGLAGLFRLVSGTATHNGGTILTNTAWNAASRHWRRIYDTGMVNAAWFGLQEGLSGDAATNTSSILAAIAALRTNPTSILQNIGDTVPITAYTSGTLLFPKGVYRIQPNALEIEFDMGLSFRGAGMRGYTNAMHGATTLLVSGASSGFGIMANGGGARSFHMQDLSLCYDSSSYTGDLFDSLNCPGVTMDRVFLGTFGTTAGTRYQTARSLIRTTYDEFHHFSNCVLDGAVDGWWSDDTRTLNANTFGGFGTLFENCVFYDFSANMVKAPGNRTRESVTFHTCAFNPIQVSPARCVNLSNVEALTLEGCSFTPSTTHHPTTEWLRLDNCTGRVASCGFSDLAKAGTIEGEGGNVELTANRIYCTDGFTLKAGLIHAHTNEFSKATNAWLLSPTGLLTVDLRPDTFKNAVTTSYYVPADSTLLSGCITYSAANDGSTSKYENNSGRIRLTNLDQKIYTVSTSPFTLSMLDAGRIAAATGSSAQTFTLPTPRPGTDYTIMKITAANLTINAASGTNFYVGQSAVRTSALATTGMGHTISFRAFGASSWVVTSTTGSWTFS